MASKSKRLKKMAGRRPVAPGDMEFALAGRNNFLQIDLDAILQNIHVLHSKCSEHSEVIAVIKANAYGHGSVAVARHLSKNGIKHFAVATAGEGLELRQAGIQEFIQIFGNCCEEDIPVLHQYQLTPTVATEEFLRHWKTWPESKTPVPPVVIKIDTGMSRNGCQPEDLPRLMKACEEEGIPVHSLMTHFAQSWDDPDFTKQQLELFFKTVQPYRAKGIKLHVSNSAAILNGFGTNLDFVRPGICIYGLPPDTSEAAVVRLKEVGLKPALAWIAHPSIVRKLGPGRHVGYSQTYKLVKEETIATFSFGYADGYRRLLSSKGILLSMNGEEQNVVGRVSMDAITVRVKDDTTLNQPFYVFSDSHDDVNSVNNIARELDTISYEIGTSLLKRLPRLYLTGNSVYSADGKSAPLPFVNGDADSPV